MNRDNLGRRQERHWGPPRLDDRSHGVKIQGVVILMTPTQVALANAFRLELRAIRSAIDRLTKVLTPRPQATNIAVGVGPFSPRKP